MDCETAWSTYLAEGPLAQQGKSYDKGALALACGHLTDCAACVIKWNEFLESNKPSPAPTSAPALKPTIDASLVYLVVKATGLHPDNVTHRTVLGPLHMATLLVLLTKRNRFGRRMGSKNLYPDGMTVGRLVTLWEESPLLVAALPGWEEKIEVSD
jgi:hypothetical protein